MNDHPIRVVVTDDLQRSRLTVFFRGILAIPHYLWVGLIGTATSIGIFIGWWIALFRGQIPEGLHEFAAGFLRYATHVEAYVFLAGNPYPGFYPFDEKAYVVDLEVGPCLKQSRWSIGFRFLLGIPAMMLASMFVWGGARSGGYGGGGMIFVAALLIWFYAVFKGRAPRGLRDLTVYCLGYTSQVWAYMFLLTDRYPYSGPNAFAVTEPVDHPVRMAVTDDLRRSRVLVFFRLPVAMPHIVWLILWSIVAFVVGILNWVCAVVIGRSPRPFHRFLAAYLRYSTHVNAFLWLVGNPFPGFTGTPGRYPIDLEIAPPEPQKRLVTFFRGLLAFPALLLAGGLGAALWLVGLLGWWASLIRGRMPDGLRNLGAFTLRYTGQVYAYLMLLTPRYPDSGPRPDPASP